MTNYSKHQLIRSRILMIEHYQNKIPITLICQIFKISRPTFYKWLKRYEKLGKEGLLDQKRGPKRPSPRKITPQIRDLIIKFRKRTRYGPKRIKLYLARDYGIIVSEHAIYRTLVKQDLIKKYKKRKKKDPRLYSMPYPGDRVQIDTKWLDTYPGRPYRHYQYTAIDDCTRLRIIRIYDNLSIYNSLRFLRLVVCSFPFKIKEVQTDNGIEFSSSPLQRPHPFTKECERLGIKHILNKPGCPEANGKVERSHRTDEEEYYRANNFQSEKERMKKLRKYLYFYNNLRPNMALGGLTPIQKLRSFKEYKNVKELWV
ncbi:MAG: IS481 family transposase [Candidatus Omnitrophica bacterium]|nr:IS481 family transposase [Candidatus Omnitrophota bacterium]